jgi:antitoxin component YwqK of YwqJK toxin-antitoxin module
MNENGNLIITLVLFSLLTICILVYYLIKPKKIIEKYNSGEIRKKYYVKSGNKVGIEKVYYRDGKINKTKNHKNGKVHGIVITYYPTGAKYIEANYEEGKLVGEYRIFQEDGNIKEIKKY